MTNKRREISHAIRHNETFLQIVIENVHFTTDEKRVICARARVETWEAVALSNYMSRATACRIYARAINKIETVCDADAVDNMRHHHKNDLLKWN